ncbi:hypothetical protein SEA_EYES_62 [Gordonia phage Eyes]|nr:hypothetical protein SEA_EYES_62 [Gordonia phage Eyes]
MHGTDELIDEIDALIGEQLAAGEPMNGYDFDDPDFPTCWHCGRDWHGLAITERMNQMRAHGELEEGYRYAEDESPVICPGSAFIGPIQTPPRTAVLGFRIFPDDIHLDPGRFVGLYQQSQSFADHFVAATNQFVEQNRARLHRAIWDALAPRWEIPNVFEFDLGEWLEPAAEPEPVAAQLPDVRSLEAEGWRPVGYVREGFVFEIDEPQVDDAAAQWFRERIAARTVVHSTPPQAPDAALSLPVSPAQRRPAGPPFWAARMDGRR